jgi:hypothetical protein
MRILRTVVPSLVMVAAALAAPFAAPGGQGGQATPRAPCLSGRGPRGTCTR